ncbi:acetylornithine transaminase [Anthocerotibacter panamensis]|uniref:acetylornithine transaminase n=1 Tax=Anthocerotibacter panamensis TaxID=2857077 RepID=UPI001FD8B829|nr:acetylornithine transaminase [Anthocerotibacter panamensis]
MDGSFDTKTFDDVIMHTYARFPLALERGAGCRVWDTDGRAYLDFVAGIATCSLGHAHPQLTEAITAQAQRLLHVSNLYYIPEQGALARWLVERSVADKVFFCNSGAEANESAIKLARKYAYTTRHISAPEIITAQASFHGRTMGAVTATGQPKYHKYFAPLLPGFSYVPYNDLAALEAALTPNTAAILLEPLQGEGGVVPGEREYFQAVRRICDERDILLIFDEVQVGMGRTGYLWAYQHLGVEPDLLTLAKALGGGIPIGALCAREKFAVFQPGDHASTFGGNPFACGVALAACRILEAQNLVANARLRGEQLQVGLTKLAQRFPEQVAGVRGWGLIQGLVLQEDRAVQVVNAALQQGLLLVPAGASVVRLVPPLIVTSTEIEEALDLLGRALASLRAPVLVP